MTFEYKKKHIDWGNGSLNYYFLLQNHIKMFGAVMLFMKWMVNEMELNTVVFTKKKVLKKC